MGCTVANIAVSWASEGERPVLRSGLGGRGCPWAQRRRRGLGLLGVGEAWLAARMPVEDDDDDGDADDDRDEGELDGTSTTSVVRRRPMRRPMVSRGTQN